MTHTLQIQTTVLPGHRIEICSPELPEGRTAQVLVTLEDPVRSDPDQIRHPNPEAEHRFREDLPQLLQTKPGRWVCYTPQGCVAEGADWQAVFQQVSQQGLQRGQYLIWRVEPDLPVIDLRDDWVCSDS